MWPMRTATPSALLARVSIGSRQCSMWGRMTQCKVNQAISSKLTKVTVSPSARRATHRKAVTCQTRALGGTEAAAPGGWFEAGGVKDMKTSVRQPSGRHEMVQHAAVRRQVATRCKPIATHRVARAVVDESI